MLFKFPANLWVNFLLMNSVFPKDPVEMKNLRGKRLCEKIVKDSAEILEELFGEEESKCW